ncbi:MAG: type VII toxin-antitoxin system MntA family adenylyltransferase antitoxin [bacterium]
MVNSKKDILKNDVLKKFCKENGIAFIALFGSFARGEETSESDIDFIVRFKSTKSLFQIIEIRNKLSKILGRKVDLVTENSLSPYLKEKVMSEMEEVYVLNQCSLDRIQNLHI